MRYDHDSIINNGTSYNLNFSSTIIIVNCYYQKLAIYNLDIDKFEKKYQLASEQFLEQFNSGNLGDEMDFFEWFGLCELRKDILQKIHKLEQAL